VSSNKNPGIFTIVPISHRHLSDINKPNQPFLVFGRLIPSYMNGKWTWTEELFEIPYEKRYPDDELDYGDYVDNPDKIIFMAYVDDKCVGQIRLRRNWNKYCYVEDIAVDRKYRGMGLGRKLVDTAVQWAKKGGMLGLLAETQDTNLAACRFYHRYGFVLGGADTMLYANCSDSNEKALFWYLRFNV